jgi:hypothetical protein
MKETLANEEGLIVMFYDNKTVDNVKRLSSQLDGYKLCYPFIAPNPVSANNRVVGFYQHILRSSPLFIFLPTLCPTA